MQIFDAVYFNFLTIVWLGDGDDRNIRQNKVYGECLKYDQIGTSYQEGNRSKKNKKKNCDYAVKNNLIQINNCIHPQNYKGNNCCCHCFINSRILNWQIGRGSLPKYTLHALWLPNLTDPFPLLFDWIRRYNDGNKFCKLTITH